MTNSEQFHVEYETIGAELTIDDYVAALEASSGTESTEFGWATPPQYFSLTRRAINLDHASSLRPPRPNTTPHPDLVERLVDRIRSCPHSPQCSRPLTTSPIRLSHPCPAYAVSSPGCRPALLAGSASKGTRLPLHIYTCQQIQSILETTPTFTIENRQRTIKCSARCGFGVVSGSFRCGPASIPALGAHHWEKWGDLGN